jgi:sialate O-acetylesterase
MANYFAASAFLLGMSLPATAAVRLPALLSDHMVLQSDEPVRLWGLASPGEHVRASFRDQVVTTDADVEGHWQLFLAPLTAGGPERLTVAGENTLTLNDVLVGQLWIASGQSNMRRTVQESSDGAREVAEAQFPRIHIFQVAQKVSDSPQTDVVGSWKSVTPKTVAGFSAIGYYFARQLTQTLNVPIGVVQATYGNTPAQSWVRREALVGDPLLAVYFERWKKILGAYPEAKARYDRELSDWQVAAAKGGVVPPRPQPPPGPGHYTTPTGLFNGMIAPLTPLTIRGVIWYQGESSTAAEDAPLYQRLFSTLITDWRHEWRQGDFPFLFAQISIDRSQNAWPLVRDAQTQTLQLRRTAMIVTSDVGEPIGQHPMDKQTVGIRFARAARAIVYGEGLEYSGPLFRRVTTEPGRLRVWFDHAASGLKAREGVSLRTFWVAGADRTFQPAKATIDGTTVVLTSDAVNAPVAARYAWLNDTRPANLVNAESLPASAFRSDDWDDASLPTTPASRP